VERREERKMSTRDKVWVKTHVGTTSQAQRAYGVQERAYWAEPRREQVEIEKRVAATLFFLQVPIGKGVDQGRNRYLSSFWV